MNLPLITVGGTNPDLIRRPPVGEDTTNPILFSERLFTKASLRILLSDTAADITTLPTVTAHRRRCDLDGDWSATPPNNGTAYGPVNATHPPIAARQARLRPRDDAVTRQNVDLRSTAASASFSCPPR